MSEMPGEKCILVTGGSGYVGSHSVVELINAGFSIVVVDNLVNASMESIRRAEQITGQTITSYQIDILDKPALADVFSKHQFHAVVHFAGLKAVGESCLEPLLYYRTNVCGTINLLELMKEHSVCNMVFSSSATVYGTPQYLPYDEKHPTGKCCNPYGKTKHFIEEILKDICTANPSWNVVVLRYFNPVGAHSSGRIGEDPQSVPNNLMPYISQVAVGRQKEVIVYGTDYDTRDGTGVRDYIHVVDLAHGHVAAIKKMSEDCGYKIFNLGTGKGYSVLEMITAFEKASGKKVSNCDNTSLIHPSL
ncbi:UDP-glucose 4-epimerase-like [Gigantopelta aegis]|uniref:UDP-glucose 4-epimerase-like n=1 Tax=Gigantopelta aegis TaxID=1735272 RepID=UPI001B88BEDF|nr:UDP-glucose 4-epimerase-like [Gigantopelta aegis]